MIVQPAPPTPAATKSPTCSEETWATIRRYRAASRLADKVYPPTIARLVKDELGAWCDWGYRLAVPPMLVRLVEQVEADAAERGVA